jgi:hypothetical protein
VEAMGRHLDSRGKIPKIWKRVIEKVSDFISIGVITQS